MLNKAEEYDVAKKAATFQYTMTEIGMNFGVDRKVISRRKKKYENLDEFEKKLSDYFELLLEEKDKLSDLLDFADYNDIAIFIYNEMGCNNLDIDEWEDEIDGFSEDNTIAKLKQFILDTNEVAKDEGLVESVYNDMVEEEKETLFNKENSSISNSVMIDWSKAPEGFDYYIEDFEDPRQGGFHKRVWDENSEEYIYEDVNDAHYDSQIENNSKYVIHQKPSKTVRELIKEHMNTDSRVDIDVEYDAVITPSSIDVVKITLKDDGDTVSDQRVISQGNPQFKKAWQIIREANGDLSQETIRKIYDVADIKAYIGQITKGNLVIDFDNETATYKNFPINHEMVKRIINEAFDDTNGKVNEKIVNFFEKVLDNPSERSVYNLYDFLKHNDIAIHDDGDIVGYKMVRTDRYDFHSGKFYNGDGEKIWMPRHEVDCEPNNTCSRGLHVCAKDYIGFYGTSTVIEVKVNPKDVCAVPYDYNGSKMRVNEYTVIGETTKQDILEENETRPTGW